MTRKENPLARAIVERIESLPGLAHRPFTMLVHLVLRPEFAERATEFAAAVVAPTRREPGCIAYTFNRSCERPNAFLLFEQWTHLAALEHHFATEHFAAAARWLESALAQPVSFELMTEVS